MVNQQERHFADLYWFGGLFDAEGSAFLRERMNRPRLEPCANITNSDVDIINKALEILEKHKIPHYVTTEKNKGGATKKVIYTIHFIGVKRFVVFANFILPYCIYKKDTITKILILCQERLKYSERNQPNYISDLENEIRQHSYSKQYTPFDSSVSPAYLAGLIDGDGCIGLYKRKNGKFSCVVGIYGNDKDFIICISQMYSMLGVNYSLSTQHKDGMMAITISHKKYIYELLDKTKDFFAPEKYVKCNILMNFCRAIAKENKDSICAKFKLACESSTSIRQTLLCDDVL